MIDTSVLPFDAPIVCVRLWSPSAHVTLGSSVNFLSVPELLVRLFSE